MRGLAQSAARVEVPHLSLRDILSRPGRGKSGSVGSENALTHADPVAAAMGDTFNAKGDEGEDDPTCVEDQAA